MTDTNYAKRMKAHFKKKLELIDLQIRNVDYNLAMPFRSSENREHYKRGRKQLTHKRAEILADIKKQWKEYKGGKK